MNEESYIYIPRPVVLLFCVLLILGCGIMVGASLFPVHEQVPCKVDKKVNRK